MSRIEEIKGLVEMLCLPWVDNSVKRERIIEDGPQALVDLLSEIERLQAEVDRLKKK